MNDDANEFVIHHHPIFVKDLSKFWYKPSITREEAIEILRDKPAGTFLIRDSHSYPGAFGLAVKVDANQVKLFFHYDFLDSLSKINQHFLTFRLISSFIVILIPRSKFDLVYISCNVFIISGLHALMGTDFYEL